MSSEPEPDLHLDAVAPSDTVYENSNTLRGRQWVGIRFDCCDIYTRVYRNVEGTAYVGRCPQCLRGVRLRVGPDGTDSRFFVAQ